MGSDMGWRSLRQMTEDRCQMTDDGQRRPAWILSSVIRHQTSVIRDLISVLCHPASTKFMSMISSYLTSVFRIPASRTTALAVVQDCGLIKPLRLHSSSL